MTTIKAVKQLHHIYPDIQGELCSRHSTLFGKLRTTFNKLYDNMEPHNYVIVKGHCQFVQEELTELKLSMALQNGFVILVSKTYPTSEIYLNSNHFGQQMIFTHLGSLQQGLNIMSDEMSLIIKDATQNVLANNRLGGIMYIHVNIPQNSFNYRQAFLMAFYIAILTINNHLDYYTKEQLIQRMSNLKFMGNKQIIQRQLLFFKNRKFNLTIPEQNLCSQSRDQRVLKNLLGIKQKSQLLLDMEKNFKFLFCKLDLAEQDVNYEVRRRKEIISRKNQLVTQIKQQLNVNGIFELFQKINEVDINSLRFTSKYQKQYVSKSFEQIDCEGDEQQILQNPSKFLQALLQEISLVSNFSNENINLQSLVHAIWQINSKILKVHAQQVVELVEEMKQKLQVQSCMVVNKNFLMIVVQKNKFTELLCEVKQKMNKGELKSRSLFRIQQEQLVLQRWNSDKLIGQKMFTSVPSQGVGVFDPSQAIWFD